MKMVTMEVTTTKSETADLIKEIDTIHRANTRHWQSKHHSREAMAEYYWRHERLEEIRREIIAACGGRAF
jgi:hypothetical protein